MVVEVAARVAEVEAVVVRVAEVEAVVWSVEAVVRAAEPVGARLVVEVAASPVAQPVPARASPDVAP